MYTTSFVQVAGADVRLYEAQTWKLNATLAGHDGRVNSIAFSSEGRLLASGGQDRTLKLWDVAKALERGPVR